MLLSSIRRCAAESSSMHLVDAKPQVIALASRIAKLTPKEQTQLSQMCHDSLIAETLRSVFLEDPDRSAMQRLVARPLGAGKSWKLSAASHSSGILPFPHPAMMFTNQVPQVGVLPQELPSVSQSVQGFHIEEILKMFAGAAAAPPIEAAACPPVSETTQPSATGEIADTPAEEETKVEKADASTQAKIVKKNVGEPPTVTVSNRDVSVSLVSLSISYKALKLVAFPDKNKIKVIKEIRQLLGLGLKEAKEASENLPKVLAKQVPREEADTIAAKFVELGGEVTME